MEFKDDVNEIKAYFREILENHFAFDSWYKSVDDIFEMWYKNKKKFIDAWGGFRYVDERECTSIMGPGEKRTLYDKIVDTIAEEVYTLSSSSFSRLKDFLICNLNTLHTNKTYVSFYYLNIDKETKIILPERKISKAIKEILFDSDDNTICKIQSIYSNSIQDIKNTGKIILSVHPLDFLSASENCHNWRSCHSFDGDYFGGNIQFMCDDVTFMTYFTNTNEEYDLCNFHNVCKWNSKKWRTFLFLKDTVLAAGNSYPYSSCRLLKISSDAVLDSGLLPKEMKECKWTNVFEQFSTYPPSLSDKFKESHLTEAMYYNDILRHSEYTPLFFCDIYIFENIPVFNLGENFLCLKCGEKNAANGIFCHLCADVDYIIIEEEEDIIEEEERYIETSDDFRFLF